MKILKIEVGKAPYEKEIENSLQAMQNEVNGLIQPVAIGMNCIAVVNEEGKINGSQPNRWLGHSDIICGDFFICGDGDEDFCSLTDQQMERCKEYFAEIPEFTGQENQLAPRVEVYGFDPYGGMSR